VTSREFRQQLARRARKADITIKDDLLDRLEAYYRLLARWNERINLTSLPLSAPTDATFDRLLVEPVAAARFVPDGRLNWFDLGSGGGSPAIPMKLVHSDAGLTMVETKTRKAAFLREAIRTLMLQGTDVLDVRFESLAASPDSFRVADLVTVRAVKVDATLIDTVARLLRPKGQFLLFGRGLTRAEQTDRFTCEQTAKLSADASSHLSVFVALT
jgi:16S rRNA (guanine527-N7)-methyltransferase